MKTVKRNIDNEIVCYYNTEKPVEIPTEFTPKKVKALWVSNVVNIDLPVVVGDGEAYKQAINKLLDTCEEFHINTLYFQVRTTNDAFYKSKLNPYSRFLTGIEGKEPPFDVLAWVIQETKKRGIEFHAWCNPYRVSANGTLSQEDYLKTCDPHNFAVRHPELLIQDATGKLILNPARDEVKEFIIYSMVELAMNYDVDGVHFDDYFYPYGGLHNEHDDTAEYHERINLEESLGDFRRRHVNDVIKGVHEALKKMNPSLQFGVSPFGIWKNKDTDPNGSNTSPKCSESFVTQYADTVFWVQEGYVDYIVPQIYWEFGHKIAPFADICDFWVDVCKDTDVKLYIGHGAYRLGSKGDWLNSDELTDQLKYANQFEQVDGNVFFTYHTFTDGLEAEEGIRKLQKLLEEV